MANSAYESSLNTWLAEALSRQGLPARAESAQGDGKRLDVEIQLDQLKIALEAERGKDKAPRKSAIQDADSRLNDGLVDCAIAICYPAGLQSRADLARCQMLHTLRTHKERPPANKSEWKPVDIAQLVSVIKKIPDQLGEPDEIAKRLSFSLDLAVARLSESQKRALAQTLDLPPGRAIKIGENSRYNQAAKRAMLVIATAVMFHAQLDWHFDEIEPPADFPGEWQPQAAARCAASADPIGAFYAAWGLWLAVDYKPIFATARNALLGPAQDNNWSQAVGGAAGAALKVTRNIVGLRHDLLGRIFHRVLDSARYDGSFYTTTAAATLLAALAIRDDFCDWNDRGAIAQLRVSDPACGTGTLLMAAAERIRDLAGAQDVSRLLIEQILHRLRCQFDGDAPGGDHAWLALAEHDLQQDEDRPRHAGGGKWRRLPRLAGILEQGEPAAPAGLAHGRRAD